MLKNEWKDAKDMAVCFKAYLFRNRYVILIMGIFVFLVHGSKLFSLNNGIDTEQIIFLGNEFYESWLGIGRQGLIFLKWLLGLEVYNPFFCPGAFDDILCNGVYRLYIFAGICRRRMRISDT